VLKTGVEDRVGTWKYIGTRGEIYTHVWLLGPSNSRLWVS
jgi:hypothetical protein